MTAEKIMSIEINIVKSPKHIQNTKVCQIFAERGGTIGRGQDTTWMLHDPERFISSIHSRILFENGQYYLLDLSTNGTFYNGSVEPIGNGSRVPLKDGDRFSLSDYEFLISMRSDNQAASHIGDDPFAISNLFASNPLLGDTEPVPYESGFAGHNDPFAMPASAEASYIAPLLCSGYEEIDPLAALDRASTSSLSRPLHDPSYISISSQPDNADPLQQAIAWPNAIPEDWDQNDMSLSSPGPQSLPPLRQEQSESAFAPDMLAKLQISEQNRIALETENQQLLSEITQLRQKLKNLENKPDKMSATYSVTSIDEGLFEAIGLGSWKLSDQKKLEVSSIVGQLVRESLQGLMQALSFRKKIKEEFRINVTTIQPVENNPLKFSANIEDALENMFIKENKAYMKPLDAVREGFQGISEHQIAVLAGIQAAFRGMIERLDPELLEKRFEKYRKAGVIKVGQKGKNWDSYKEFHQDLVNNMDNSFQYLFGHDFMRAYEDQLQRLIVSRKEKASAKP